MLPPLARVETKSCSSPPPKSTALSEDGNAVTLEAAIQGLAKVLIEISKRLVGCGHCYPRDDGVWCHAMSSLW